MLNDLLAYTPIIQKLSSDLFLEKNILTDVLRLDLLHPEISGNKYFKLKYNIKNAIKQRFDSDQRDATLQSGGVTQSSSRGVILTFGGAHSNHIYATAAYCNKNKLKCIGVIRGEETAIKNSPTLQFAIQQGMHLHFVSREKYKNKDVLKEDLKKKFGEVYIIPEGGNNDEGAKGCMEILSDVPFYDYIFCACGTACTFTGLLASAKKKQIIVGISVLKGENKMTKEVNARAERFQFEKIMPYSDEKIKHSVIIDTYHFGGYAKHTEELLNFKINFEKEHEIPLDYIYTAKLFYSVFDLVNKNKIEKNTKILIIHSGGIQGNAGYEQRYHLIPKR